MPRSSPLAGCRPNIVFVLADDLSYRDLGCFVPLLEGRPLR